MPEVSVVMSCYNAERWLQLAIDSVLTQTLSDLELILVDDGSTDETPQILETMRQADRRIVVISQENSGLARSLNAGIERATGQWIARLDADDLCEPTRLETQLNYIRRHPGVVLLGSGFQEINASGQVIRDHHYPSDHNKLADTLEKMRGMFPHSSAVFHCEAAQRVGLYNVLFDKSQDWDLWLRLSEQGNIACLPKLLVKIRKHGEQISSSKDGFSQFVYGASASTCHFLRLAGEDDPSGSSDMESWHEFLRWVRGRLADENIEQMYESWRELRAEYLRSERSVYSFAKFASGLVRSGHLSQLVASKWIGSSLPRVLAREWVSRQCAA